MLLGLQSQGVELRRDSQRSPGLVTDMADCIFNFFRFYFSAQDTFVKLRQKKVNSCSKILGHCYLVGKKSMVAVKRNDETAYKGLNACR